MDKIQVTKANCEEIASQLVQVLFDKKLAIVSTYSGPYSTGEPKIVTGVKIASGFTISEEGKMVIPLIPRRKIIWDLVKETVYVTIFDEGIVLIERGFVDSKKIFRTIVSTN